MNNGFVKIGEAAKLLGVSLQALRNGEAKKNNAISPNPWRTKVAEKKTQLELHFGSPSNTSNRTESE